MFKHEASNMFGFFTKFKKPAAYRLDEVTDKNGTHWEIWEKKPYRAWKYHFVGEAKVERNKERMLNILAMLRDEEKRTNTPITRKVIA